MIGHLHRASYRRWNYGVTYRKEAKVKDKHFTSKADAEAFYEKQKKNLNDPILFRFQPEPIWVRLPRADVYWLGYRIKLWFLVLLLGLATSLAYLWRVYERNDGLGFCFPDPLQGRPWALLWLQDAEMLRHSDRVPSVRCGRRVVYADRFKNLSNLEGDSP